MIKTRETNYDLLRVMAMLAVIVIHVSESWICGLPVYKAETGMMIDALQAMFACVCKAMAGFAVPCFVMLSGAFNLSDERNGKCGFFYRKIFLKIGIHTAIFSILYFLYRTLFCFIGEKSGRAEFMIVLLDLLRGRPMGHMGYLYRMFGVYLLSPFVFRLKSRFSDKILPLLSVACFVLASMWYSWWAKINTVPELDIGQTAEYMGYYLLGYMIRRYIPATMPTGIVSIVLGFLIEIGIGINQYSAIFLGAQKSILESCAILSWLLIFAGFTMITVPDRKIISQLTGLSFIIYLIHQGVLDVLSKVLYHLVSPYYYAQMNSLIWIPVLTLVVLLGSAVLTYVYNWAYDKIKHI